MANSRAWFVGNILKGIIGDWSVSGILTAAGFSGPVTGNVTSSSVTITGGTINATPIGATTPSTGAFTTLSASGAVTVNGASGAAETLTSGTRSVALGAYSADACYLTGSGSNVYYGAVTNHAVVTLVNGATVSTLTNTGLAVTGAISATDNVTISKASGALNFSGATLGQVASVGDLYIDSGTAKNLYLRTNSGANTATLDTAGNFAVGATPIGTTGSKLQMGIASSGFVGFSSNTGWTGAQDGGLEIQRWTGGGSNYYGMRVGTNVGNLAFYNSAGAAVGSQTWTQTLGLGLGTSLTLQGATTTAGTGIAFPATQVPSSDPNTLDDYRELTFTATATGMTTSPTGTATAVKNGNSITIEIPTISATSNAATFTLTGMPSAIRPSATRSVIVRIQDNGGSYIASIASIDSAGTITIFASLSGATFTTSGTKSIGTANVSYVI